MYLIYESNFCTLFMNKSTWRLLNLMVQMLLEKAQSCPKRFSIYVLKCG